MPFIANPPTHIHRCVRTLCLLHLQCEINISCSTSYIHATELQAVSVGLVMWHQIVVVENSYPENCGVDADTQEEDTDKAHYLVERNRTDRKER